MSNHVRLSASRIGTAKKCSWVYWSKYVNKIPDSSNTGASRGSVCHNIFEYLGKDRHKKHLKSVLEAGTIKNSKGISKLVKIQASAQNPPVDNEEDLDLMDKFIVNGLNYDFYGDSKSKPYESISEKVFDLEVDEDGKNYHVYGFIDKLFLYDKGRKAIVRDFKTSKKVYVGSEVTDNLQNLIYCLAVKKLYPQCKEVRTEFLFLNFDLDEDLLGKPGEGVLQMDLMSEEEMEGLEHQLTGVQAYLDNFNEEDARSNLAANQPYPKDKTFAGPISCGFASYPGQLKKDGNPMWYCNYKFAFDYWALKNSSGKLIATAKIEEKDSLSPNIEDGEFLEKLSYEGCPKFNSKIDPTLDL